MSKSEEINTNVAIKLNTLAKPPATASTYTYQDLHLDLEYSYLNNQQLWRSAVVTDVKGDYDLGAIKNSITNIFTTIPGQKILNPLLGLNLMIYLFDECTATIAQQIGNLIYGNLSKFEPRVIVQSVQVLADPDNQQYIVNLTLGIPFILPKSFKLVGNLSTAGFYFVNN
jgi:phage baseplate assembly protein W